MKHLEEDNILQWNAINDAYNEQILLYSCGMTPSMS